MERSIDTIMTWLTTTVKSKAPISPHQFVEAGQYMVILIGEENEKLYELESQVAKMKVDFLDNDSKRNVSQAKMKVEATDTYKQMRKQKARIEQILEAIRIAKLMARMTQDELRSN